MQMSYFIMHQFNNVKESVIKIMDWCSNVPYRTFVHFPSSSHSFWLWGSNNGNPKYFPQDELTAVETHPLVITRLTDSVSKNSGV